MHRAHPSWVAALAVLCVLWLDSHAWTTSSFRIPRRYRPLDVEHATPKLRSPVAPTLDKKMAPKTLRPVQNVQELRKAVLDDGLELRQILLQYNPTSIDLNEMLNHQVIQLIQSRARTRSVPGNRQDNATLALSLEGGGMRGAVSAGMAAAIASLGLCDVFDAVYGSSAGSVVGAYMVSRQMCVDVYTDVLPAAQTTFVCKKRMMAGLVASAVNVLLGSVKNNNNNRLGERTTPGMNISFVLDGIMNHEHGLRPLDLELFRANDCLQPLRIATSCVKDGMLTMKCLGTKDFFPHYDTVTNQTVPATARQDGLRKGIYACLEAGMTVPGATGPPVMLVEANNVSTKCFDAFCFEPLPYRSAVEDGATHVLVLRSRPECFQPKTKPGVYEKGVAPIYFRSHGEENVARFFDNGGQQYIYLEDILTLEEGRQAGVMNDVGDGIHVPPTTILYGVQKDENVQRMATNRDAWKKAHLLPIIVPKGTPELSTLEQDQDAVLEAMRGGFAVAFDMLAPCAGLKQNLDKGMTGERVAQLVFPKQVNQSLAAILGEPVSVRGHFIDTRESVEPRRMKRKHLAIRNLGRRLSKPFRRKETTGDMIHQHLVFSKQVNNQYLADSLGEQVSVRGHSIGTGESVEPRKMKRKHLAIRNVGRRLSKPFRRKETTGDMIHEKLVFSKQVNNQSLVARLGEPVSVRGHSIGTGDSVEPRRLKRKHLAMRSFGRRLSKPSGGKETTAPDEIIHEDEDPEEAERCHRRDANDLLGLLPGIQNGNLPPLAYGLHYCRTLDTPL